VSMRGKPIGEKGINVMWQTCFIMNQYEIRNEIKIKEAPTYERREQDKCEALSPLRNRDNAY
jgi:hypothetical protein